MAHQHWHDETLAPSVEAQRQLDLREYLRGCDVTGKTYITDASIIYEVVVGDWIVWRKVGVFGKDDAHRAAGAAFVGLAQQQEAAMHDWADKILDARKERS